MELIRPIKEYAKKFRYCFNCNHGIKRIKIGKSTLISNDITIPITLIDKFTFPNNIEMNFSCSECNADLSFLFENSKLKQVVVYYNYNFIFCIKNSNSIEKEIYFGNTSIKKDIKDFYNFDYKKMFENITIYY